MNKWTSKESIVFLLTIIVGAILVIPVIGSTASVLIHGHPVNRPEFLDKITEIVVYMLGVVSGYVLRDHKQEPPQDKESKDVSN